MARNENQTSVRQLAFAELDTMPTSARKDAVNALVEKFDIGLAYARTLFQDHRNQLKKAGTLIKVYSIKEGKNDAPTVVTSHVLKADKSDATSPGAAVEAYVNSLSNKIEAAKKIDIQAILEAEKVAEPVAAEVKTEEAPVAEAAPAKPKAEKAKGDKSAEKETAAQA